jgi:uracil permease
MGENMMKKNDIELDVNEIPKLHKWLTLSLQHLFAMFGATVLVPLLTGLNPAVALVSSGLGTIAYLIITRGQIPAYLGSSFAFIFPILSAKLLGGPEGAMVGSFLAGVVYGIVALLIKQFGTRWLMNILPPVVVGPVIIVIGLSLASVAINMSMYENPGTQEGYSLTLVSVALVTLGITVFGSIFFRGFFGLIPILIGVGGGYTFAYTQGLVNFTSVLEAGFFVAPQFIIYTFIFLGNYFYYGANRNCNNCRTYRRSDGIK